MNTCVTPYDFFFASIFRIMCKIPFKRLKDVFAIMVSQKPNLRGLISPQLVLLFSDVA